MRPPFVYAPPQNPTAVLHETDSALFVDKPTGLLSVPGRLPEHQDNLLGRLQAKDPNLRLIHRLDMDTSGVMVFAKTADAQRAINRQFEQRSVHKTYLAEVTGQLVDTGTVDLPLIADWPNRPLQKVDPAGKPSITHWRLLARRKTSCLVELTPETGRSHQLRVHMAAEGHAILGDVFYGDPQVVAQAPRLMLHASTLTLALQDGAAPVTVAAPNADFEAR